MEGREGSNQFHAGGGKLNTKDDQNDDSPREMVRPSTSLNASNNDSSAADAVTMKRGPGRPKGSGQRSTKLKRSDKTIPNFLGDISYANQATGNSELVSSLMMRFDAVRRHLSQVRTGKGEVSVALDTFKNLQLRTNTTKRVGSVPGVNVGDIFFLWGEMELVGLHGVPIGIDTMGKNSVEDTVPLAISVVSSGKNADKGDDPDTLIFTGHGGTGKYSGQASDQRLEMTNLSLENTLREKSSVRVTRAVEDVKRTGGKIYIYDGLYSITDMWDEKSEAGYKVFKFRLVRQPDQKHAFGNWKSVEQWKKGLVRRPGLVLEDLSYGAENIKVTLVNEVDTERGPVFSYITSLKQSVISVAPMVELCTCQSRSCSVDCVCVQRNGGELPYVESILVTRGETVYECGDSCACSTNCKNKMIHTGVKFSLEVFKTMDCGWGLRSWDPIRAGSFICEYAGEIIEKAGEEENDYIFDTSRDYKPFQWNYEPELVGKDASEKVLERIHGSPAFVISAKESGNVARFMNHSCSPNVFWQTIAREEKGVWCLYIGFFAMKHIPPLTELRYDYGASGRDGKKKKKMCLCRSEKCSGSFGW